MLFEHDHMTDARIDDTHSFNMLVNEFLKRTGVIYNRSTRNPSVVISLSLSAKILITDLDIEKTYE